MLYIQHNPQLEDIITSTLEFPSTNNYNIHALTAADCAQRKLQYTYKQWSKWVQYVFCFSNAIRKLLCKAWDHGNEGKLVSLTHSANSHLCPYDLCAQSEWAFRSIFEGMKALSSLAGHYIIFHSPRKVMTGSNPYWINAFMKAPLFPWSHTIRGLQSPGTWRTTVYPTQPSTNPHTVASSLGL